ncbi:hypothetical protein BJV78DRAFT_896640 [Lactifluus subvellereus]|nr:hypothetical protein BJV78DRAFT_896640 [Lactifluus subvellereus]
MTSQGLPDMHYITEPQRAQIYPAVIRINTIPSIPSTFPFKAPQTPPRARGPRYTIGWLEFQSPEQPDPEVARPGDVWIQLPLGHRKARVYACYTREGKDWSPWVGNATSIGDRSLVRTHPFLNSDHAQRRFYLVFNGREFVWANIKAISNIEHNSPQIAKMGPADAVAKWLEVSGKRGGPRKAKEVHPPEKNSADQDSRPLSAPPPTRKHARFENIGPTGESTSAPPAKRPKSVPRDQPPSPSDPSPTVRSGPYAKAGATQIGWIMYINGTALKMPTACFNCARDKTPCSGLLGERCGRCRFKKRACSHSKSSHDHGSTAEPETKEDPVSSPVASKPKSALRGAPQKPKPPTKVGNGADVTNKRSSGSAQPAPVFRPILRPAFPESSSSSSASSPLSSVGSHRDSDSGSSVQDDDDQAELDAPDDRDDAAVENLLNSATTTSVGPVDEAEPSSSATAANGVDRSIPRDEADDDEEDEELARFVQMTLDGMARVQEGLRGVFTLQRRKSGAAKRRTSSPAKQVAGTGAGA